MRVPVLIVLAAASLEAQARVPPPVHHHDWWVGVTGGRGSLVLECRSACGADAPMPRAWRGGPGTGVTLTAGRTVRRDLLLGVEIGVLGEGGNDGIDENGAALMWATLVAHHHPLARMPFFVTAGAGAGTVELDAERYDLVSGTRTVSTTGPALQAGLGWDVRLPRGLALTPLAEYVLVLGKGRSVTSAGRRFTGPSNPAVFLAGMSLNWY